MQSTPLLDSRCVMKSMIVPALAVAVSLAGWLPSALEAEERSYFKVEIKGEFQAYTSVSGEFSPMVLVKGEYYELDLKSAKAKLPDEKQLEKLDHEFVVVHGHLVLDDVKPHQRVVVTKITLVPVKAGK